MAPHLQPAYAPAVKKQSQRKPNQQLQALQQLKAQVQRQPRLPKALLQQQLQKRKRRKAAALNMAALLHAMQQPVIMLAKMVLLPQPANVVNSANPRDVDAARIFILLLLDLPYSMPNQSQLYPLTYQSIYLRILAEKLKIPV